MGQRFTFRTFATGMPDELFSRPEAPGPVAEREIRDARNRPEQITGIDTPFFRERKIMHAHRLSRFESLEKRLALAVTAAVTDGDLIISGDADGAVEITAVSGGYEVRDNGVLIADSTTLTGVTDDIKIHIDSAAGADNTVALDLTGTSVDRIYADLGDGANSLQVSNGSAARFIYDGGNGADAVTLDTAISGYALVKLGNGDNSFTLNGTVGHLGIRGGSGVDSVTIAAGASVTGNAGLCLGNGDNTVDIAGSVAKNLFVGAGSGADILTLAETSAVTKSVFVELGNGNNTVTAAGSIGGSLRVNAREGNDAVTIAATANIADAFFARLAQAITP